MFGGDPLSDESNQATLIIGVGYQPLSIIEIVRETRFSLGPRKLFLPFPSIPPGFTKNWRFVAHIKKEWSTLRKNELPRDAVVRVPVGDTSLIFDRLLAQTNRGREASTVLAPFGPKPMSLAMCLLGIASAGKELPRRSVTRSRGSTIPIIQAGLRRGTGSSR